MGKSICLLPDSRATKQTSRHFAVWQTTAISLPRVTCDEEPLQCVNRQIASALHFKLMHSTVPSIALPCHAGSSVRISNRIRHVRDCTIRERSTDVKEKRLFEMTLYTDWALVAASTYTDMYVCTFVSTCWCTTSQHAERSTSFNKRIARSYFIFDRLMCKISNKTRGMFV